jgi:hypothetical protein
MQDHVQDTLHSIVKRILRVCFNQSPQPLFGFPNLGYIIMVHAYDFLTEHFMENSVLWEFAENEFPAFIIVELVKDLVSSVSQRSRVV